MAPGIVLKIEDRGSAIIEGSLERSLVKEITEIMLDRIGESLRGAANAYLINMIKWFSCNRDSFI